MQREESCNSVSSSVFALAICLSLSLSPTRHPVLQSREKLTKTSWESWLVQQHVSYVLQVRSYSIIFLHKFLCVGAVTSCSVRHRLSPLPDNVALALAFLYLLASNRHSQADMMNLLQNCVSDLLWLILHEWQNAYEREMNHYEWVSS